MILAFGVTFELPVFTFFLVRVGILNYRLMWRSFRYAIVLIFIAAAILTPTPDVINQNAARRADAAALSAEHRVAYVWRKDRDKPADT
jgi:ABC-type bacteriocin/lantibiotic exporter with double-glycine peptidase domain